MALKNRSVWPTFGTDSPAFIAKNMGGAGGGVGSAPMPQQQGGETDWSKVGGLLGMIGKGGQAGQEAGQTPFSVSNAAAGATPSVSNSIASAMPDMSYTPNLPDMGNEFADWLKNFKLNLGGGF